MDILHDYKKVDCHQKAYQLVKSALNSDFIKKYKINPEFDYKENHCIKAIGSGFSLQIDFKKSHLEVDLNLAFPFKLLKPKILASIKKEIGQIV